MIQYRTGRRYPAEQVLRITAVKNGYIFYDDSRHITGFVEMDHDLFDDDNIGEAINHQYLNNNYQCI